MDLTRAVVNAALMRPALHSLSFDAQKFERDHSPSHFGSFSVVRLQAFQTPETDIHPAVFAKSTPSPLYQSPITNLAHKMCNYTTLTFTRCTCQEVSLEQQCTHAKQSGMNCLYRPQHGFSSGVEASSPSKRARRRARRESEGRGKRYRLVHGECEWCGGEYWGYPD
ncbi:hypothetical protein DL98DRAFT_533216 [Cadophora sp. DSE1049]|nr:hypothetical protein DL98DRAFT_533216 [Cadophora sp. DSE1049]